jgi:hypothetical protein
MIVFWWQVEDPEGESWMKLANYRSAIWRPEKDDAEEMKSIRNDICIAKSFVRNHMK